MKIEKEKVYSVGSRIWKFRMYGLVQLECGLNLKRSAVGLLATALAYEICGAKFKAVMPPWLFLSILIHLNRARH